MVGALLKSLCLPRWLRASSDNPACRPLACPCALQACGATGPPTACLTTDLVLKLQTRNWSESEPLHLLPRALVAGVWGYWSTDGLGLFEYMLLVSDGASRLKLHRRVAWLVTCSTGQPLLAARILSL